MVPSGPAPDSGTPRRAELSAGCALPLEPGLEPYPEAEPASEAKAAAGAGASAAPGIEPAEVAPSGSSGSVRP